MKVDLKKQIAAYSARRGVFDVVDVPSLTYLMVDGHGDPNGTAFAVATADLFSVAYKLKFLSKRELDRDYVVMPLEGLWWSDDMASFSTARDKSAWSWTLMNLVPEWVDEKLVERARTAAGVSSDRVRCEQYAEGRVVQTLHVGPFDDEGPVLEQMHREVIPSRGLALAGRHHEIYFSDVRRTDPAKLRTILRQPVR
ncbi:GyrI-like domain-containing protein [Microbacterium sp. ARD31]|jgi:hypothetical protein|uniref:GyrI-like domain-containing protein n=1 Tax=Microbacterium sp. ARD31 TaxID=2962576 RepID=UPI0028811424|nr:GyrI-like domain-containing protein [Microbacterium sp. ARD31]MDT0180372.1 GyrI-like domain-containing protein [Microbacterium sp. ARD31]